MDWDHSNVLYRKANSKEFETNGTWTCHQELEVGGNHTLGRQLPWRKGVVWPCFGCGTHPRRKAQGHLHTQKQQKELHSHKKRQYDQFWKACSCLGQQKRGFASPSPAFPLGPEQTWSSPQILSKMEQGGRKEKEPSHVARKPPAQWQEREHQSCL